MSYRLSSGRVAFGTTDVKCFGQIRPTRRCVILAAKAGFGESNKRVTDVSQSGSYLPRTGKRRVDLRQELWGSSQEKLGEGAAPVTITPDFKPVGNLSLFPEGKSAKVVELAGYGALVLYKHKERVYASNVHGTAYSFPLVDADVMDGPGGEPVVEVPLDGTQYDLRTGKVLKWCPGGMNPIRGVLSMLKSNQKAIDLVVYQTIVNEKGDIYVKVTRRG